MIEVFRSPKIDETNRAAALLDGAGIRYQRARIVGDITAAMPALPQDQLGVAWVIAVERESRDEAREVLAALIRETGARPGRSWVGPLYVMALLALTITLAMQTCG